MKLLIFHQSNAVLLSSLYNMVRLDKVEKRQLVSTASSSYGNNCCPPVVDPYTWLALIAGICLATYFLRIAITTNVTAKKRKKRYIPSIYPLAGKYFIAYWTVQLLLLFIELHEFESRLMTETEEEFVLSNTTPLLEFSQVWYWLLTLKLFSANFG